MCLKNCKFYVRVWMSLSLLMLYSDADVFDTVMFMFRRGCI